MPIIYYSQLSHAQRRNVHQLLQHQKEHDFSSYPPLEDHQWVYLEGEYVCATLGYHTVNDTIRFTNGAYSELAAFRKLARFLHQHVLRRGAKRIHVQVFPPHDSTLASIWKTLGYTLYAEQFRLIGLSHGHPSTLRLKFVHAHNQALYLSLRNTATRESEFLFPHDAAHLEKAIHQKVMPYIVYDQQLIVGTLLFQKRGKTIRLLEITCLPELRKQGYGSRILNAFQEKLRRANILTFEVSFLSIHEDVLRLYEPNIFCDIQLSSHWHTFTVNIPPSLS